MNPFTRTATPAEFSGDTYRTPHPGVSPQLLEGQHSIRAWEYSQAMRAYGYWQLHQANDDHRRFVDVGGGGSRFYTWLAHRTNREIAVIDPTLTDDQDERREFPMTLAEYRVMYEAQDPTDFIGPPQCDAVFCLSVIEHLPRAAVPQFFDDLKWLLRPGGLLVLTCDLGPPVAADASDICHFHWMRQWLPRPDQWWLADLWRGMQTLGAGRGELIYAGPTVFDYSVASIALVKPTQPA